MNPILKNVLAVAAGILGGSIINFTIVMLGIQVVPLPAGVDPMDPVSMKAAIPNFTSAHYIFPFIAHALGTLAGAFICTKIAASHSQRLALIIGFFFLLGGAYNVISYAAPMWFEILDLAVAYIPMAILGWNLAKGKDVV